MQTEPMAETFACAINCMDGRVQDAVKNYLQERYGVAYVDMVTEPGPNKILADDADQALLKDIGNCVTISVQKHGSKVIAIAGHAGCAGNPVGKEQQIVHLKKAKEIVERMTTGAEVILLWVGEGFERAELVR